MAFSVQDFHDLIRILDERPEWRAELRRLVLTDELLALPQLVQELVEAHRQAEIRLTRVEERLSGVEERLSGVEERLSRVEEQIAALIEAQRQTETQIAALTEAQRRTEVQMAAFIERFEKIETDLGKLKGYALEDRYQSRPFVYFKDIVRRARALTYTELDELLQAGVEQGRLTEQDMTEVLASDVVARGLGLADEVPVYVVGEVSWGIGPDDIERAAQRAAILARLGTPAIAVAAGEWATPEARRMAGPMQVWLVTDGRAVPPEEVS